MRCNFNTEFKWCAVVHYGIAGGLAKLMGVWEGCFRCGQGPGLFEWYLYDNGTHGNGPVMLEFNKHQSGYLQDHLPVIWFAYHMLNRGPDEPV